MPTLGAWDTVVTDTWDNQTEKWDLINFILSGTFNIECELESPVAFGIAIPGNLDCSIELNSPQNFQLLKC